MLKRVSEAARWPWGGCAKETFLLASDAVLLQWFILRGSSSTGEERPRRTREWEIVASCSVQGNSYSPSKLSAFNLCLGLD